MTFTQNIPCHMINCFCMFSDYQPLTLDEWIENDRRRREGPTEDRGLRELPAQEVRLENAQDLEVSEDLS